MPDDNNPKPPVVKPTGLQRIWPYIGMVVLGLVLVALTWSLYSYAKDVGYAKLGVIETARPLLVIAAIISTIAFGGALLFGAIFSSEGTFDERFRHAKEIFLFFSGVFGTVIGFYFGAGDGRSATLIVSGTLQESMVVAHVSGGSPPYRVTLLYGPKSSTKTEESKDGWVRFQMDKEKDYILPSLVVVTDSKGLQGSTSVPLDADQLKAAKWKLPAS